MFHFTIILLLVCCAVIDTSAVAEKNLNYEVKKIHRQGEDVTKNHEIETRNRNEKTSMDSNDQYMDGLLSRVFPNQRDEFRDLEDLLRRDIRRDIEYREKNKPDPEVGFGGSPRDDLKRILFANMTIYVNKAINQAQQRLGQFGSRIYTNIPPYVVYKIPRTPIAFVLKYIEGASTITPQGTSTGLHYFDSLYTFTQFKFQEIRYNYEVQIKLMNWLTICKSLTVVLENPRVWMPVAVENNVLTIQRFEFLERGVTLEGANNRFINYLLNDILVDEYYPETKQLLVNIASRDTKLLLDARLENAQ